MFNANSIRTATFARASRGYKIQDVDDLLEQAADSLEQLEKENADLLEKIKVLADRIQEYRNDEDSIRSALLTAQKSADRIMKDANIEKEQLITDARQQADDMLRLSQEKVVTIANETKEKATKVIEEAKEKANTLLTEAKDKSARMLYEAVEGCKEEKRYLDFLKEQEKQFRNQLIEMYKEQFEILKRGPEVVKDLDTALSQQEEPSAIHDFELEPIEQEQTVEQDTIDEAEETDLIQEEAQPSYIEPEDIPLPIDETPSHAFEVEELSQEESGIDEGFEIKRKFTDLKFGDDYDIASDDDYDEV